MKFEGTTFENLVPVPNKKTMDNRNSKVVKKKTYAYENIIWMVNFIN